MIGNRTLGSQVRNFVEQLGDGPDKIEDVVEEFRKFFMNLYGTVTVPTIEKLHGKKFSDIPEAQRPGFGFVIAGFSRNAGLAHSLGSIHSRPATSRVLPNGCVQRETLTSIGTLCSSRSIAIC